MKIYNSPFRGDDIPVNNIYKLLFDNPTTDVPRTHIVYINPLTGASRTRGEHIDRVRRLATALVASHSEGGLALTRDQRVGILCENDMDYSVIAHACYYVGIPVVLLNVHSTRDELVHSVDLVTLSRVFVSESILDRYVASLKLTSSFSGVRITAQTNGKPNSIVELKDGRNMEALLHHTRQTPTVPVCEVERSDLAHMLFSSGTSGKSKAVMISHGNLIAAILQSFTVGRAMLVMSGASAFPRTVALAAVPMYHTYGFFSSCVRNHSVASTCVILSRWDVEAALRAIVKYKIQQAALVPTMIRQLVNSPLLQASDPFREAVKSMTGIVSAAASLSPQVVERLYGVLRGQSNDTTAPDPPVSSYFGASEASVAIALPAFKRPKLTPPGFSSTRALMLIPNMEAVLRHDTEQKNEGLPPGFSIGELCVRGPNVGMGYWGNERATKETFGTTVPGVPGNDWLRTGDRFIADQDGHLWFVDRMKDIMKIWGTQVAPEEIEETILNHCRQIVNEVSVVGVSIASVLASRLPLVHAQMLGKFGAEESIPRAWIVLSPEGRSLGEQKCAEIIDAIVCERLSKPKWLVGGIEFIDELPKNGTGKILRRALRNVFETRYISKAARL